ncbi:MAG: Ig-like domain repeat protein [Spirochaetes bacterium]|nr:Ig-like domain repeat protein [Spirochaetota bacterium]
MLKKLLMLSVCITIGVFFTSLAFTQDDPSTTDPTKIENAPDESMTEVKDDVKTVEPAKIVSDTSGQQSTPASDAKAFFDGKTIFVNPKVLFKLTTTDDLAIEKIEYKLDDAAPVVYENPFSISPEGYHTIKYYGTDKAGNIEAEKTYNVAVDNTGPAIVVTTDSPVKKIGETIYYQKNVLFSVNTSDALSGVNKVEYSTDGANYQEYAAPFSIPATGDINLKVRAIDNVNNLTEQFSFRVLDDAGNEVEMKDVAIRMATDETAPTVEIKPDKEIKKIEGWNVASTDVKYTVEAKDDGSGVAAILYRVDGKGEFIPYKSEIQFLNNGKHQIDARALDKAGNISGITSYTVYVDILPPVSNIETVD